MTAIVPEHIKTKKQLREYLKAGKALLMFEPHPWGEATIMLNVQKQEGGVVHMVEGEKVSNHHIYCTNRKRSWHARIDIKDGGLKVN